MMLVAIGLSIIAIAIIIATKERDPKLPKEMIERLEKQRDSANLNKNNCSVSINRRRIKWQSKRKNQRK